MNKKVPDLIRKIVEYKWHGEGNYEQLQKEVEEIKDSKVREVLEGYLREAREFVTRSSLERDVEKELLEEWLLSTKPIKMKYKGGKYKFELEDEQREK